MSVPMVQKQKRQKSSLIMGAMLALLLGVAAGFFVLAMPTSMLETITTFSRLSSLMIQAEPPISPSDKTILAVLAGVMTAGIGWVLVDWLLFGRAGMRTLIREREDDYEDEDGDAFRPTDPLDLVAPVVQPTGDWAMTSASDARRPLSARTDIGDPPKPNLSPGLQPAAMPGIHQLLPPIDQILPTIGTAAPALVQPFGQAQAAPNPFGLDGPRTPVDAWSGASASAGHPGPSPFAVGGVPAPGPGAASPGQMAGGGWLPTPGVRADGSLSTFDVPDAPADETPAQPATAVDPAPLSQAVPPLQLAPGAAPPPLIPPPLIPSPLVAPPMPQPMTAPAASDPFAAAPAATQQQPFAPPSPFAQTPVSVDAPPLAFTPPAPAPAASAPAPAFQSPVAPAPPTTDDYLARPSASQPATARSLLAEPSIDKAQLEDLLGRLERGLQKRRAAQAARAVSAPPQATAPRAVAAMPPVDPRAIDPPSFAPAPPAYAQPEPAAPMPFPIPHPVAPPPAYSAPQPVMPTTAPVYDLPHIPTAPAYNLAPLQPVEQPIPTPLRSDDGRQDELLDQPLHVTLELLRNRVKR